VYSFPLGEHEHIFKKSLANFYCDDDVLHGALYLTNERLVFVGFLLDVSRKYMQEVPLTHIEELKPDKTFFIIPNVLIIRTIQERRLKFIMNRRDEWLDVIHRQISQV
jgi:hypothetical protein